MDRLLAVATPTGERPFGAKPRSEPPFCFVNLSGQIGKGMAEPFAQFRLKQLVGVSKPVGLIGVSIGSTAMLRSAIAGLVSRKGLVETMLEVLNVAVYPSLLSLPAAMVHSGRPQLLQPACVVSHLIRSWALWCVGIGLAPNAPAIRTILQLRIELVLEVALAFQDQMSLPAMAILHAFRQAGWMSILVWCMDADPLYTFLRGVCNWLVMMLLACAFEARTWTAYQRHCRALQQQAALPALPPLPDHPAPTSGLAPSCKDAWEWEAEELPPFRDGCNDTAEWEASAHCSTTLTSHASKHKGMGGEASGGGGAQVEAAPYRELYLMASTDKNSTPGEPRLDGSLAPASHSAQVTTPEARNDSPGLWLQPPDSEPVLAGRRSFAHAFGLTGPESANRAANLMLSAETLEHSCMGSLDVRTRPPNGKAGKAAVAAAAAAAAGAAGTAGPAAAAAAAASAAFSVGAASTVVATVAAPLGSRGAEALGGFVDAASKAGGAGRMAARSGSVGDLAPSGPNPGVREAVAATIVPKIDTRRVRRESGQQPGSKSGSSVSVGVGSAAAWLNQPTIEPQPQHLQTARNVMQVIEQQRRMVAAYTRNSRHTPRTVNVKIKGVELEQLPDNMSALLQQQLHHSMPGIMMTGVSLRNGCIMLTLDLLDLRRYLGLTATVGHGAIKPGGGLASSMMEVITRIMPHMDLAQLLEDGTAMCIQTPDEVVMCHWDADKATYHAVDSPTMSLKAPGLAANFTSARGPAAGDHHLLSAAPAVHVLPAAAAGAAAAAAARHQLTLTVELQLPSNCRLDGWQRTGDGHTAGAAGAGGAGTSGSQRSSCDGPVADASLLARRVGGGYLPVVVQRLTRTRADGTTTQRITTAEVLIALDGAAPASLCLELWFSQPATGGTALNTVHPTPRRTPAMELLVSHMPLLVLPASCRAAAVELEQHVDHVGGVRPRQVLSLQAPASATPRATNLTDVTDFIDADEIHDEFDLAASRGSVAQTDVGSTYDRSLSREVMRSSLRPSIISAPDNVQIESAEFVAPRTSPATVPASPTQSTTPRNTHLADAVEGLVGEGFVVVPSHTSLERHTGHTLPASAQPILHDIVEDDGDGPACLLEDLGTWLSHHHGRTAGGAGTAAAAGATAGVAAGVEDMVARVMQELGLDLLVYSVQHGLKAVAALIANTMQRAELQGVQDMAGQDPSVTPPSGADKGPSAWFLHALQCATATTTGDAGDQATTDPLGGPLGGGGGVAGMGVLSSRMGLLHAAMISGQPTVLAQVLRWGTLYGGVGWSWPWSQEDGSGLHALHLAATQPSGVCAALLETIMWALTPAEAEVARGVWLHSEGGVGAAPAAVFALVSPHGDMNMMAAGGGRATTGAPSAPKLSQVTRDGVVPTTGLTTTGMRHRGIKDESSASRADGKANTRGSASFGRASMVSQGRVSSSYESRASATGSTGAEQASQVAAEVDKASKAGSSSSSGVALASVLPSGAVPGATTAVAPTGVVRPWLGGMAAVWIERETDEYRAWVKSQMSSLVRSWAATMILVWVVSCYRSAMAGCLMHDVLHISLHNVCHIPLAAAISGVTWLGNWQVWSLVVNIFHALAFAVVSRQGRNEALVWTATAGNWADAVYIVVLTAAVDQTPLPQLLLAHLLGAYFHSLAYASAGVPHPLTRALCVHASALLVTTLSRTWQRRNYLHWKHNAQQALRRLQEASGGSRGEGAEAQQRAAVANGCKA